MTRLEFKMCTLFFCPACNDTFYIVQAMLIFRMVKLNKGDDNENRRGYFK